MTPAVAPAHQSPEVDTVSWARELRWFARQPARVRRLYLAALDRMDAEIPAAYRIRFEALVARSA